MKYFSVAIVAAFLCAAAVSGAPSTPNPTFEELAFNPIAEIGQKLRDYWASVKCISDVITEVVGNSEVGDLWQQTKNQIINLVQNDWQKCDQVSNQAEQQKCRAEVIRKGAEAVTTFLKKLVNEAKWGLVKEIQEKIQARCLKEVSFDMDEEADSYASLPEQFQCLANVLGEVSKRNGLEDLWSQTQPKLQEHLDNWKNCGSAGGKPQVILCNIKEGVMTYKMISEYLRMVAQQKPEIISEIAREVQAQCSGLTEVSFEDVVEETNADDKLKKLKCIKDAITDAVKETDFAKIWDEYKRDLEKMFDQIKACKNEANKWEETKCVAKESKKVHEIFRKFLGQMKKANRNTFDRVKKYIKQRCFQ